MARTTTQKAILKTDTEKTAPEKQNKPFSKSRKRTSLDEFAITHGLRPEVKAGFKAWLQGQYFHFDDEWQDLFKKYTNR